MAEYIVTPDKKDLPSGPSLLEELHRRGYPVEINVKGTAEKWEMIRFFDPGPPEMECLITHDAPNGRFSVSVSTDAPPQATELQMNLVDIMLRQLGGQTDNSTTRERYSAKQFTTHLKKLHGTSDKAKDIVWLGFSWGIVVLGILLYFSLPPSMKPVDVVVVFLSLLSAGGLTYSHFKA
jgi:hypothetical protein